MGGDGGFQLGGGQYGTAAPQQNQNPFGNYQQNNFQTGYQNQGYGNQGYNQNQQQMGYNQQ